MCARVCVCVCVDLGSVLERGEGNYGINRGGGEVCFRQVMGCGIGLEKGKGRSLDRFAERFRMIFFPECVCDLCLGGG